MRGRLISPRRSLRRRRARRGRGHHGTFDRVEIVRKNTDQVGPRRWVVETIFRMDRTKSLDEREDASRYSLERSPPSRSVDTRWMRFEHEATPVFAPREQCVVTAPPSP